MVLDAVSNFVRGTTDAAVDSTQTTVSVTDASIFPDPASEGEYNVVIWDASNFPRPDQDGDVEILRVTAIDTGANDLTVTRAQETTTAAAHPDGSAIHLSPTAKMFSDIESEYTASGENFDGEGTSEFSNLQSVNTERIVNGHIYAGNFSGADADDRLDAALSSASGGDLIKLEQDTYTKDRSIASPISIVGDFNSSNVIDATWTLSFNRASIRGVNVPDSGKLVLDGNIIQANYIICDTFGKGPITVNGNRALIVNSDFIDVTFASGSTDGLIDSCTGTAVTDNGTNSIGDIT